MLLRRWKLIRLLVSNPLQTSSFWLVSDVFKGLQTPRLKRLAEIVSAQAMAQQEKLEMAESDLVG